MLTLIDTEAARAAIAEVLRHPDDVPEALVFAFETRESIEVPSHLTASGRPEVVFRDLAWFADADEFIVRIRASKLTEQEFRAWLVGRCLDSGATDADAEAIAARFANDPKLASEFFPE